MSSNLSQMQSVGFYGITLIGELEIRVFTDVFNEVIANAVLSVGNDPQLCQQQMRIRKAQKVIEELIWSGNASTHADWLSKNKNEIAVVLEKMSMAWSQRVVPEIDTRSGFNFFKWLN